MDISHANKIYPMLGPDKNYDVVVMGLGVTGLSCVRYFVANNKSVAVCDDNENTAGEKYLKETFPDVDICLGPEIFNLINKTKMLVVSPGIPMNNNAVQSAISSGIEVISDVDIFLDNISVPVLAVTGSNGKSTVATLLTDMINLSHKRALLGGNIGIPVLDLLNQTSPDYYVLELSSYQLELISRLNATSSVLLNISPDHIERYKDIEEYARTKARIFSGDGHMILNKDDDWVCTVDCSGRSSINYSTKIPVNNEYGIVSDGEDEYLAYGSEKLIQVKDLKISGQHNYSNALAALAMGHSIGLPHEVMTKALQKFSGLPHRCQWINDFNGVSWYNDSKGTNPAATISAINSLATSKNIILIAGGVSKNSDLSELATVCQTSVNSAILIGQDAAMIERSLAGKCDTIFSTTMETAVETANKLARPGDIVLLSPACASFDMFDNFEDRGDVFIKAVKKLAGDMSS